MASRKKVLYYAVNGSGQGVIFTTYPVRDEHWKMWCGDIVGSFSSFMQHLESEGFELPSMKWSDEPLEITVTISYGNDSK